MIFFRYLVMQVNQYHRFILSNVSLRSLYAPTFRSTDEHLISHLYMLRSILNETPLYKIILFEKVLEIEINKKYKLIRWFDYDLSDKN